MIGGVLQPRAQAAPVPVASCPRRNAGDAPEQRFLRPDAYSKGFKILSLGSSSPAHDLIVAITMGQKKDDPSPAS